MVSNASSQVTNQLLIEKNLKAIDVDYSPDYANLKSALDGSELYLLTKTNRSKNRVLHCYDLEAKSSKLLYFEKSRSTKLFLTSRISKFAVVKSKFVFLCSDNIYIFELQKENQLALQTVLNNAYGFMNCQKLGENILLDVCYNYHPLDQKHKNVWAILNLTTNKIDKKKFHTNDNNPLFGSFVNDWVDVCENKIAYVRTDEYKITIHDENFRVLEVIKTDELKQNDPIVKKLKDEFTYSKDGVESLWEIDQEQLTRIRKVYYFREDLIFVLLKLGGKETIRVDYWKKNDGKWNRVLMDSSSVWFEEEVAYSKQKMTYTDFYQNVFDIVLNHNGNFYLPYYPYIPIVETDSFNRYTDYIDLQNEAIENDTTFIGIKKIQIPDF